MGSTVTAGKQVCAIRDPKSGQPVYLLFELLLEKNCYPHTPHWGCICIGGIERTLEVIFDLASVCEGGMLQGRSGRITPEGYIQGWMRLLAAPLVYPDIRTDWSMGSAWNDFIDAEGLAEAKAALQGNPDAIALLEALEHSEAGRSHFMLHEQIGALAAIMTVVKKAPWRVIDHRYANINMETDCRLGYAPKKAGTYDLVIPELVRIDQNEHLMKGADGMWRHAGWAYSIVGDYVDDLWKAELREPGSYRRRIKAYRQAVEAAPLAQFPMQVRLDTSNMLSLGRYQATSMRDFLESDKLTPTAPGVFTASEPAYHITHAPRSAVVWEPVAQAA